MSLDKWDTLFLDAADDYAKLSSCCRRQYGAIIARGKYQISSGYNGTPEGMLNCNEGGCVRCNQENVQPGVGYESCSCIHSEENAIFTAARMGVSIDNSVLYVNGWPCFSCLLAMKQCKIVRVVARVSEESRYAWVNEAHYHDLAKILNLEVHTKEL